MYYGPYVNQYICTTDHTSASTYALRTIRQPVHMYYGPYVNQYICTTDHTSTSTYVLQTIRQPVHMYYRPYVSQYICTTDPMLTSTYVLQTLRQPVHMYYRPYVNQYSRQASSPIDQDMGVMDNPLVLVVTSLIIQTCIESTYRLMNFTCKSLIKIQCNLLAYMY